MRNIQIENAETGEAQIGRDARSNARADADRVEADAALPPPPARWVPHRKAEVLTAVRNGALSLDKACAHYGLSMEEYLSWQRGMQLRGLAGLQVSGSQARRRGGSSSTDL